MRILFSLDKFTRSEGGADKLARGVVSILATAGHEVRVLQAGAEDGSAVVDGAEVRTVKMPRQKLLRDSDLLTIKWNKIWHEVAAREIGDYRPGLVITQNRLCPSTVAAAREADVRSAIFFHGYRAFSPTFFYRSDPFETGRPGFAAVPLRYKLKWPWVKKCYELYAESYSAADVVVANSSYAARVIEKICGRTAKFFYPVADIASGEGYVQASRSISLDDEKEDWLQDVGEAAILFVKPQKIKGLDVVLNTAKHLPQRQFVIVGAAGKGLRKKISAHKNIKYINWTDDMPGLYRRVSVLFGPSQIPEPFGRVFVEAGLHGVPSVASAWGGIPEAVGQGGELLPYDAPIKDWAAALERVSAPENRPAYAEVARRNAENILNKTTPERLLEILGL